jgi:hypothetical protein
MEKMVLNFDQKMRAVRIKLKYVMDAYSNLTKQ